MNAEDIFRCSIGCKIMLMIKARIRLIFSSNTGPDCLNMTLVVDWDVNIKPNKQTKISNPAWKLSSAYSLSTHCDLVTFTYLKIFQYCTCLAEQVTHNFHSSCKHMHLSFKSVCNKEDKEVICNMTYKVPYITAKIIFTQSVS